jgi:hypothetical protein
MKKILITFLIISALIGPYCFSNASAVSEPPQNQQGVGTVIGKILNGFPAVLRTIWQEALSIWGKMFSWVKNFWNSYIAPWLTNIYDKVKNFLAGEVEKRKPEAQQEFEKDKQEMKQEVPQVTRSLWERFKELIK